MGLENVKILKVTCTNDKKKILRSSKLNYSWLKKRKDLLRAGCFWQKTADIPECMLALWINVQAFTSQPPLHMYNF